MGGGFFLWDFAQIALWDNPPYSPEGLVAFFECCSPVHPGHPPLCRRR